MFFKIKNSALFCIKIQKHLNVVFCLMDIPRIVPSS